MRTVDFGRRGSYNDITVWKKIILSLAALLCVHSASGSILKITVAAPIHPISAEYIAQAIERAEKEDFRLLLIVLDTPGGLDSSMRDIISRILGSKVPVVTFVAPSGARAASAGFFIAVASDIVAMAPGTSTGAAHPVGISITGQAMDKTMEEKVTHDAASYIKTLAEKRGRNIQLAEDAVRKSLSYTEKEAFDQGLIDLIAKDEQELLRGLDGRTIERFDGTRVRLDLKDQAVIALPMTARQKFLLTISNPNLAYILLMLGLLGLYFEFSNPGAILPGVLGGISLLLAIFSFQILPINYVGLILILLAIGLFILEVKVQSYGILSVGGVIAMVIGSIMLINSPIPELRPSLRLIIPMALSLGLIFVFLVYLVIRAHAKKVRTGKEGLVGEIGTAQTDLRPEGKVFVHGELWNAEAEGEIPKGAKVQIVRVLENLRLRVKRL